MTFVSSELPSAEPIKISVILKMLVPSYSCVCQDSLSTQDMWTFCFALAEYMEELCSKGSGGRTQRGEETFAQHVSSLIILQEARLIIPA